MANTNLPVGENPFVSTTRSDNVLFDRTVAERRRLTETDLPMEKMTGDPGEAMTQPLIHTRIDILARAQTSLDSTIDYLIGRLASVCNDVDLEVDSTQVDLAQSTLSQRLEVAAARVAEVDERLRRVIGSLEV